MHVVYDKIMHDGLLKVNAIVLIRGPAEDAGMCVHSLSM